MTQKKRIIINAVLTLIVLVLVAFKLIIWHVNGTDMSWVFESLVNIPLIPIEYGIFLSALLTLITIWLPLKPRFVFGIVALCISGLIWILEFGFLILVTLFYLLFRERSLIDPLGPLLSAGVIVVLIITTVKAIKYHKSTNRQKSTRERTEK